jgi:hypothetical protein
MSEPMLPVTGSSAPVPAPVPPQTPPPATVATVTGRVTCKLEEELADQRSNVVTYRFLIENGSSSPIDVFVPVPRVVKDVKVKAVTSSMIAEAEEQRLELCAELEALLSRVAFLKSEAVRKAWAEKIQATAKDALAPVDTGHLAGDAALTAARFVIRGKKFKESLARETSTFRLAIRSSTDATAGYKAWLQNEEDLSKDLRDIREHVVLKIGQLVDAEDRIAKDRGIVATVEPGATLAHTYILRFPRTWFDPRKDQISVEAGYREQSSGTIRRVNATQSLLISPFTATMSVIAVVASAFGVATQLFLKAKTGRKAFYSLDLLETAWYDGSFTVALAVAFVFFNVYEHTKLAKAFGSLRIGWRAAALIGFLCGMAYDRILNALTALIG